MIKCFSENLSTLRQTPDAENFAKVFTGLIPLNILAKSSVSWFLMGSQICLSVYHPSILISV